MYNTIVFGFLGTNITVDIQNTLIILRLSLNVRKGTRYVDYGQQLTRDRVWGFCRKLRGAKSTVFLITTNTLDSIIPADICLTYIILQYVLNDIKYSREWQIKLETFTNLTLEHPGDNIFSIVLTAIHRFWTQTFCKLILIPRLFVISKLSRSLEPAICPIRKLLKNLQNLKHF